MYEKCEGEDIGGFQGKKRNLCVWSRQTNLGQIVQGAEVEPWRFDFQN